MEQEKISGAVLSRATLKKLIDNEELVFFRINNNLTYDNLTEKGQIDETSVDLHIGELFQHSSKLLGLDIQGKYDLEEHYEPILPDEQGGIILDPNGFLLGKTQERITIPKNIIGVIGERRTSAGNLGLIVEGFIPPGLEDEHIRFTLYNAGPLPVRLYIGKVPPMKALFHTLSSSEVYREGRETRVAKDQTYSSGAGDTPIREAGVIFASLYFSSHTTVKRQLTVNFHLENATSSTISSVKIFPLLNTDIFQLVACSHGWKLDRETNGTKVQRRILFRKSIPHVSSISLENTIGPGDEILGTFGIVFSQSMHLLQFKFEVVCLSDEGIKLLVKYPHDFPPLVVEEKGPILLKQLRNYIIPAIIAAIMVLLISNFGQALLDLVITFLSIFLGILG